MQNIYEPKYYCSRPTYIIIYRPYCVSSFFRTLYIYSASDCELRPYPHHVFCSLKLSFSSLWGFPTAKLVQAWDVQIHCFPEEMPTSLKTPVTWHYFITVTRWAFQGPPNNGTPYPYYSHTTPIRIPKGMGMLWEKYGKLAITMSHYRESRNHPWVNTSTSIYTSVTSIASLPVLYLWSFTWAKILQHECMSTGKHPLQTMIQRPICLITMSLRVGGLYISSSEKVCDVCASLGQTNADNLREELDCSACSNSKIKKNDHWSLDVIIIKETMGQPLEDCWLSGS